MKSYTYIIGIDPGVNTGMAVWQKDNPEKKLDTRTYSIHKAMELIKFTIEKHGIHSFFVRIEDARKRKWFGNTGKERLKGAGSVERDCKIWEDFLTDLGVDFELVHPKNSKTKWNAEVFHKVTKFTGRTSQHARDAAMLVYGL